MPISDRFTNLNAPMNYNLLEQLCKIHAPSGNEAAMKAFILDYVTRSSANWATQPQIIAGDAFQDCVLLVFGKPRTVVFAHMDSIGFTARYHNNLVKIGGPVLNSGIKLIGADSQGRVEGTLVADEEEHELKIEADRPIEPGTELVFACDFRETGESIQSCYLDNRLGVFCALQLAETLQNGIIAFSCWEEHGGGSVGFLARYIYETYKVRQALICDITWVTEGVLAGKGPAISLRDSLIPRRSFVEKVKAIAREAGIPHQLEVEGAGGSDGKDLQHSEMPWDWCFVGAAEQNVHSPDELVHKADIVGMVALYRALMEKL